MIYSSLTLERSHIIDLDLFFSYHEITGVNLWLYLLAETPGSWLCPLVKSNQLWNSLCTSVIFSLLTQWQQKSSPAGLSCYLAKNWAQFRANFWKRNWLECIRARQSMCPLHATPHRLASKADWIINWTQRESESSCEHNDADKGVLNYTSETFNLVHESFLMNMHHSVSY